MKILAFVDTHGMKSALMRYLKSDADVTCLRRRFHKMGESTEKWIGFLEKNRQALDFNPHSIHESDREVAAACKTTNSVFIFTGLLMNWVNTYFSVLEAADSRKEVLSLKSCKTCGKKDAKGKRLLFTACLPVRLWHNPLDPSFLTSGHRGCGSIRKFIEEASPMLCICGHIHETAGNTDIIGKAFIINPGPGSAMLKV